ncbi:MAG: glycosyltransferase family 39 protein, partial [Gaiellaceae bacterium]
PLDNSKYFDTALDFPNVPVDLWTLRIGLIAPVRLALLVFGPSEAALYAVPIAAGLLLSAAVYGTMLLLFGDRVLAASAALVTVLSNVFLFTSSFIYPDTTATATLTAGFFFLVLAAVRTERGDTGWMPTAAVVTAGVLFGASYLIREFSPILLPAVIAAVVLLRFTWRRIALLAGAAIATASLEFVYGAVRYGDPFIHIEQLFGRNTSGFAESRGERMDHIQSQLGTIFDTILVGPRLLLAWRTGWIFLLVVVIFVVALVLVRDRRFWVLAAWCISFWAIMIVAGLGELPSGRWILNITNVRYWFPILPALVMASFGGLWLLLERWFPTPRGVRLAQASAAALAVVILVPGVAEFRSCASRDLWGNDSAQRWHDLRSWLGSPEADRYDVIWTDYLTHRLVPAYSSSAFGRELWDGELEKVPLGRAIRPATDLGTSLILVHKPRLRSHGRDSQRWLDELRSDWSPVFVSDDREMIVLAHESASNRGTEAVGEWSDLSTPSRKLAAPGVCGRSPYEPGRS